MGLSRRSLIVGLTSFLAAPAIVRVASLELVRGVPLNTLTDLTEEALLQALIEMQHQRITLGYTIIRKAVEDNLYGDFASLDPNGTLAGFSCAGA